MVLESTDRKVYTLINLAIALVWFINGFFCKVLNLVPRHQQIVSTILDTAYSRELTRSIGYLEIGLSICIAAQIKTKYLAIFQISIILLMNSLEFIYCPEHLLWGKFNLIFALLLCVVIGINEYLLKTKKAYGVS